MLTGWGCVAAFALAALAEVLGLPEELIERALASRLAPTAGEVRVEDAELDWTRRGVRIRGVSLGGPRPDLRIEELNVRLGWRMGQGLALERAEVGGADLRVSHALITSLEGLLEGRDEARKLELPEVVLRGLSIEVETPEYGDLDVGELDLALLRDAGGELRLTGRLVPALGVEDAGEVFLEGSLQGEDVLQVRGAARALPVSTGFLPDVPTFAPLHDLAPSAAFDLEALATWHLGEDVLPTARATLGVSGGSLALPWLDEPEARRVRDIEAALEISFDPEEPLALWDRDAWYAAGHARAAWEEIDLDAAVRIGRAAAVGRLAEAWCHAPSLPLDDRTLDLGARSPWLLDLWEALTPSGQLELLYGFAIPRGWTPDDGVIDTTDRVAAILPGGRASAAYVGWPGRDRRVRDQGFPLPLERVDGRVYYAHRGRRHLAEEISIFDLVGHAGSDQVHATCSVRLTPAWTRTPEQLELGPERFHLLAESERLTVGDHLRPAFEGLRGIEGCEQLWTEYLPRAGGLGVRLELVREEAELEAPYVELATDLRIEFQELAARWVEFPLPCDEVDGTLHLLTEGRGPAGRAATSLDLRGRAEGARGQVRVVGRSESGPDGLDASRWEVAVDQLDVSSGRLREVIGLTEPRALAGLEAVGIDGLLDTRVTVARPNAGAPQAQWLAAVPTSTGLRLRPEAFPLEVTSTEGHLNVAWGEGPASDVRFGLFGAWEDASDTPVWLEGHFTPAGDGELRALGAGVDPLSTTLVSALESTLSRDADEPVDLDVTQVDGQGRVDFGAHLTLDQQTGDVAGGELSVQLRLEHLGLKGTDTLRDLRGAVTWDATRDVWTGPLLTARVGRTPVRLTDAALTLPEEGGWSLEAGITAESVPIDREHLRFFLDARTVRALLEDLDLRGRFDVEGGTLALTVDPEGTPAVRFGGKLEVHDLHAVMGVPVGVKLAREVDLDLRLEGDSVRALARVGSLSGEVAGRRLDEARMQLTYIGPRLTIEALDGAFEGGRLRSLGGRGSKTFFAIDLEPPFPFVLAGRMGEVDVGRLLRGVFNSSFANRGLLDAELRLSGDLENLTGIRGAGSFELSDSALWAVPVFQAVLSQLGFPTAATFSTMAGDYRVAAGVLAFPELRLQSDLMSLVGGGTIDFDGVLAHDFEVRYALLDQFGPLTRLLYGVQNSLLRISVQGDMSRPEVIVKGLFSQFFAAPSEARRLPLPSFSGLPTRF